MPPVRFLDVVELAHAGQTLLGATFLAAAVACACPAAAQTAGTGAWPPQWRALDGGQSSPPPAWNVDNTRNAETGQLPIPPRIPDTSEPWQPSGGGEAAGRIGLPRAGGTNTQTTSGGDPLLTQRTQASALSPRSGRDRASALDAASVFRPRSQDAEEAADQRRLRQVVDQQARAQSVPGYDQTTGAGLARRARVAEEDAYAPLGIRAGSFILRPSLELRGGHTAASDGQSVNFLRLQPEVALESDWSRHAFNARGGIRKEESSGDASDEPQYDATAGLRIDINRDTVARFDLAYTRSRVSPTDPDLPSTALEETSVDELSLTASLSRRFGRFLATLSTAVTDFAYGETQVSGGGPPVDGSEQDYRQYETGLRLDYEATGRIGLFAQGAVNTRDYDADISSGGLRLGSDGVSVLAGLTFGGDGKLTGDMGIGYQHQSPDEPTHDDINAFLIRGTLIWQATPLTTFTFTAESEIDDTVSGTSSGYPAYTFRAGVSHALRRNVILTAGLGFKQEDSSKTVSLEAGGEYRLNRSVAIVGDVTHEHSRSDGSSSDETTVTMGLRLQR